MLEVFNLLHLEGNFGSRFSLRPSDPALLEWQEMIVISRLI